MSRRAPDFRLEDLSGHAVTLTEFHGKIVSLDFQAAWCGPCRFTMPLLEQLQQEYPNDSVLLAINVLESPDVVAPFVKNAKLQTTILVVAGKGLTFRHARSSYKPISIRQKLARQRG